MDVFKKIVGEYISIRNTYLYMIENLITKIKNRTMLHFCNICVTYIYVKELKCIHIQNKNIIGSRNICSNMKSHSGFQLCSRKNILTLDLRNLFKKLDEVLL